MVSQDEFCFSLQELANCITRVSQMSGPSLEELAGTMVSRVRSALLMPESEEPAAALLRMFMTHPYASLDPASQRFIAEKFPDVEPTPEMKCLTLVGTDGDEEAWRTLEGSEGHRAIPLVSEESVRSIPMIARLITQLGLEISDVLTPDASSVEALDYDAFGVFHVEDAAGSEYIPAQDSFVRAYGVKSVVGFGSMLPTGHLCVVLMFSKAKISAETAQLFRPLALGVRIAVLPHMRKKIIAGGSDAFDELESVRAQHAAQRQLLSVFHDTVVAQSDKLDGTLDTLRSTNDNLQTTLDTLHETQARLVNIEAKLIGKYAMDKLRDPATYRLAFVVGTLINIYGHLIVPMLRGRPDAWQGWVDEVRDSPALGIFSILLAYLFPVGVQIHSAVRTRMRGHAVELRASFADNKPDPVFRAGPEGRIIDAGVRTQSVFSQHKLERAQDVLGAALFDRIIALQAAGDRLPRDTSVRVEALDTSFVVAHSPASDGAVNIYLTEIDAR